MQQLNLQPTVCSKNGSIFHETMHSLGFYHMHSSRKRSFYVKILWDNIKKEAQNDFLMLNTRDENDFGYAYDISSILHYSPYAFAKVKGLKTMEPIVCDEKLNFV